MDEIMYEKLKTSQIAFKLTELTLKESAKSKDAPYIFDAKGDLAVAGVTNSVAFPVNITLLDEGKAKATATVPLKMSDFKIEPPAPKIALGLIKTGDDVKIIFDWNLALKK
jgi:polyisoprenoid-binding protein YceI